MVLKFALPLAVILTLSTGVVAEELRVGGKPLEQALDLPNGSGGEQFVLPGSLYVGNFPDDAAQYDTRAAFGRLDRGEIGAYLAAVISNKPVTGTATYAQSLVLLHYAAQGGGQTGAKAEHIKAIRHLILDQINQWICPVKC